MSVCLCSTVGIYRREELKSHVCMSVFYCGNI